MKCKLIISIPIEVETEEEAINEAKDILLDPLHFRNLNLHGKTDTKVQLSLIRDGDRSAGNLLLPKLEGRVGQHYQTKKATLEDLKKKE